MKSSIGSVCMILLLCTASLFAQAKPQSKAPPPAPSANARTARRPLSAAALPHATNLSWTSSATTGATYNVYKAPCTGFVQGTGTGSVPGVGTCTTPGTFVKLTATPLSAATTTFSDTNVTANVSAVYQITSVCASAGQCPSTITVPSESVPSNAIAALTPGDQPQPPILSIPSLTKAINPNNTETVTARWTDYPNVTDRFQFSDGISFLQEGVVVSRSGAFAELWTGSQRSIWFTVCNVWGTCTSASTP